MSDAPEVLEVLEAPEQNWNTSLRVRWGAVAFLAGGPIAAALITPYYVYHYGVHWVDVLLFGVLFIISNTAISAGYHRYFSHLAYECHPCLQAIYLIFGTLGLQFSAIDWSRNHRVHHQYADTDLDPHNIKRGFIYAHVSWVIHETPLDSNFFNVPDLLKNKLCVWQKKYYWAIFTVMALLLPTLIGAMFGRPFGGLLWGALLRLVVQGHTSYSINSFAHTFGKRPFSNQSEARDSWILALITNGEGFHNFHHRFASDYRNGWRWYHWDPTKWLINACRWGGLTWGLKKASDLEVLKAQLLVDTQQVRAKLQDLPVSEATLTSWQERLIPVRRQLEKMASQMTVLKLEVAQATNTKRREFKEQYQLQRESFSRAFKEWKRVKRRVVGLSAEQANVDPAMYLGSLMRLTLE